MTKVVSVIPKEKDSDTGAHVVHGTQVLLSDGSRLEGVQKVTLAAEVGGVWKAIIEVNPVNQKQIDTVISELNVIETTAAKTTTTSAEETNSGN